MSRTEELRRKLRSKKVDDGFYQFQADLNAFLLSSKSARSDNFQYNTKIFVDFKNQAQMNVDMWLENELREKFLSDHRKPTWSFDADWCFHENEPMVFVNQFTDSEGVDFYVFKITTTMDGALKTIYKMFAYEDEDKIVLNGIFV